MDAISSHLPPFEGWLPKWILLIAVTALGNSIQSYLNPILTARLYNPNPDNTLPPSNIAAYTSAPVARKTPTEIPSQVTPLSSRTFGTWTFLTSVVRLYVAYHINEPAFWQLGVWTFVVAFGHFATELWKGTTRVGVPVGFPVAVSSVSLVWMWMQRDFYLAQ